MNTSYYSAFGLTPDGNRLIEKISDVDLLEHQLPKFHRSPAQLEIESKRTFRTTRFRSAIPNPNDPSEAGWGYLLNPDDPNYEQYVEIVKPLAEWRKMPNPSSPIHYKDDERQEWEEWFYDFTQGEGALGKPPRFILIVGGPDQIPFQFQFFLSAYAKVGRVYFDTLDDLEVFVQKIIKSEQSAPGIKRESVLFGTDEGMRDPTRISRQYMIAPFHDYLKTEKNCAVTILQGEEATKANLVRALHETKPALVFTASHGLEGGNESIEFKQQYNGAICCQNRHDQLKDRIFSAADVPDNDIPFLEGSIFFQFACFGIGTPAQSHYSHWFSQSSRKLAESDFIAALPKRLLAHPKGPIAYIGHLDTSFVHGFADPHRPFIQDRWHKRIIPFKNSLDRILRGYPVGLIIELFTKRFNTINQRLTNKYDSLKRRNLGIDSVNPRWFTDNWIFRTDARDYMLFGDPASASQVSRIESRL